MDFVSAKNGPAWFDSEHDLLVADVFCYEAAINAETDGYDAVIVDTTSDSGVLALRSRLSIPVVGVGEVSYHIAGILGRKFSMVTLSKKWEHISWRLMEKAGYRDACVSVRYLDVEPDLENLTEGKEDALAPALLESARRCVEEDGADVIILGSTTMHGVADYLAEHLDVPVINPGLVGFWFAHMLVQTRLAQSKRAFPSPAVAKDDVFMNAAAAVNAIP